MKSPHFSDSERTVKRYASVARAYFKDKRVYRYRLKKISEMDDREVIQKCHFYYTENHLESDYRAFEADFFQSDSF